RRRAMPGLSPSGSSSSVRLSSPLRLAVTARSAKAASARTERLSVCQAMRNFTRTAATHSTRLLTRRRAGCNSRGSMRHMGQGFYHSDCALAIANIVKYEDGEAPALPGGSWPRGARRGGRRHAVGRFALAGGGDLRGGIGAEERVDDVADVLLVG